MPRTIGKPTKDKAAQPIRPNLVGVGLTSCQTPRAGTRVVGWTDFRDGGGALIAEVATNCVEVWVGTRKMPQIRLRPAADHADEVGKVHSAHELLVSDVRERMHDVRALVAMGVPMIVRSGRHRVLADRYPHAEYKLVDAAVKRIRTRARGKVGRVQAGISDSLATLVDGMASVQFQLTAANRWAEDAATLMRELPEKVISGPLRKQLDLLLRERAKQAADAETRKLGERDLERY